MDGIQVDTREVMMKLTALDSRKMNKAYRDALKKSVQPIQKQARQNLKSSGIKGVSKKYVSKTGKTYNSMISGIKISVDVRKPGEEYAKVHIRGDFRLPWMEVGTSLRKTDKGWNRGQITGKWFFKSAVDQKSKEVVETLENNIKDSINKVWNGNHK